MRFEISRAKTRLNTTEAKARPSRIEDYAFVSDTQSGALISRSGGIDWLCLPRFDSGACLRHFSLKENAPALTPRERRIVAPLSRRYLILETDVHTGEGWFGY